MNTNTIALTKNLVIAMEEAIASIDAGMHLGASVTLGEALWKNRAAIAALEAQPTGWMPIESAPKDKVLLLGYFNESGKWRTVRGEWFCQEEIDDQWEFPENGSPGWYETCVNADEPPNCWPIEPTHWMPLPTPPKD